MMKKLSFFVLLLLVLTGCNKVVPDANIDLSSLTGSVQTESGTVKTDSGTISKKTFIGFVGSFCSHCIAEMPTYEKFYLEHKGEMNMQLIVIDSKKMPGNYTIPQDLSNPVSYESLTKEKCDYVPSYVIYDENKKIVDKQCGAKLTYEDLKTKLLNNTSQNTNTLNTNTTDNMKNTIQTGGFQNGDVGVIMTTTNGKIEIKLFPELAPKTVLNFLALSQKGYYNGITFHRVIKNFMIQGGDPTGTGMGGESIFGKEFEDEFSNELSNIKYSLSMANAGPGTNGSQFFINQADNTYLNKKHTVFGQVVSGMDNVDKIAGVKTDKNDKPLTDVKIIKMEVVKYESGSLKPFEYKYEDKLNEIKKETEVKKEANKNRVVKVGDTISVDYVLTVEGKEVDNSYKRGSPIEFAVGSGMMIPGFDKGVLGMKIGDKKTLKLEPKDAYGEYDEKKLQEIPKTELKQFEDAGIKLEVGSKLPTQYGQFEIKKVTDTTVTVDLNHELAGKKLQFEVEMVDFK